MDADLAEHVLGCLVLEDVDQVVGGEGAEEVAVVVDHGEGEQLVALEHARRLLLVGVRGDGDDVRAPQLCDRGVGRRGDERAQVEHPIEALLLVRDVDVERLLGVGAERAQLVDHLPGEAVWRHRDPPAGHPPAGAVLVVLQQNIDRVLLAEGDGVQHVPAHLVGQLLYDVGGDVVGDAAQDLGDARRFEADQEAVAVVRLEIGEGGADLLGRELLDEELADLVVDAGEGVGELGGVELAGEGDGARGVAFLQPLGEDRGGLDLGYDGGPASVLRGHATDCDTQPC